MAIVVGNSEEFQNKFMLPRINYACTVSVMLVDYITDGQEIFFSGQQWLASEGLVSAYLSLGLVGIELVNSNNISKILHSENSRPAWDRFIKFVVTINNLDEEEIYRYEDEYIEVPDYFTKNVLNLAYSQFSGNCEALVSCARFLTFASHKSSVVYKGKRILISGCGTGAEALICKSLGASYSLGFDIDYAAIEFATDRFKDISGVEFTTKLSSIDRDFDLVISRHVLEHIPRIEWKEYFIEICNRLNINGELLIDVPNQLNPREPHTDILFFHLLNFETKRQIINYCDETNPAWYEPIKEKINALATHKNIELDEVTSSLPSNFKVKGVEYIDSTSEAYNGKYADTIRVVLSKIN